MLPVCKFQVHWGGTVDHAAFRNYEPGGPDVASNTILKEIYLIVTLLLNLSHSDPPPPPIDDATMDERTLWIPEKHSPILFQV